MELAQEKIKLSTITKENETLKVENENNQKEIAGMNEQFGEARNKIAELEEYVTLLQQKNKDESKLPTLRGQSLENAKMEIGELRRIIEIRDKKILELEMKITQREAQDNNEGRAMVRII